LKSKRIGLNNEGYEIKLKNVLSSQEFINNFQEIFNSKNYQVNKNFAFDEKIKNFKIVTGAGGDLLIQDQLQDCFFVTGEIK
jgi:putative NIF3 family GTP cyclohydrolase 1 type 2